MSTFPTFPEKKLHFQSYHLSVHEKNKQELENSREIFHMSLSFSQKKFRFKYYGTITLSSLFRFNTNLIKF